MRHLLLIIAAAVLPIASASPSAAQPMDDASERREAELKAGYLVNFAKLVEWPAGDAGAALIFCFLGGDGIHDALAVGLERRRVGSRLLELRRLASADDAGECNVLYLDARRVGGERALAAARSHALTVSDIGGFASRAGMIELFTDSNRLRFNINVANAGRAGLKISSSLLQLAVAVEGEVSR